LFTAAVGSLSPIRRCCSGGSRTGHVSRWRPASDWHPADGHPQAEQAAILEQLIRLPPGIAAVTASADEEVRAGGHAAAPAWGEAIVTAPTRSAVEVLASFAGETLRFMAPDALLASKKRRRG
jgi:tRNA(Met) cytidine acetyltransferase